MCAIIHRFLLVVHVCGVITQAEKAVQLASVDIQEIDELSPVDIGHVVPTGPLTIHELVQLNLMVWAKKVLHAIFVGVTSVSSDPSANLPSIATMAQRAIDPDFSVHACVVNKTGTCLIRPGPKEDKNRYLDLTLSYTMAASAGRLRFVIAEDAAKAVNYPLSFDVVVVALRSGGSPLLHEDWGRHWAVPDIGPVLNSVGLKFANSTLISTVVTTIQGWPWNCTQRDRTSDFFAVLKRKVVVLEKSVPGSWEVQLVPLSSIPNVTKQTGIAFQVEYSLCGHLMMCQFVIESRPSIKKQLVFV